MCEKNRSLEDFLLKPWVYVERWKRCRGLSARIRGLYVRKGSIRD